MGSPKNNGFWLSISDLMSGLMVIAVWTSIGMLRWLIPLATSIVGLYLVWNNVRVFMSI